MEKIINFKKSQQVMNLRLICGGAELYQGIGIREGGQSQMVADACRSSRNYLLRDATMLLSRTKIISSPIPSRTTGRIKWDTRPIPGDLYLSSGGIPHF